MLNKIRRVVEKIVAPRSVLSYAQSGEDLVLDFLTDYSPTGFYVDVGCNHPVSGSNSFRFYRKGWRGICVDANADFGRAFASKRPRDTFVCSAVSDKAEIVSFHHFAQAGLSSVSGEQLYENSEHYALRKVETLTARTLTTILDETNCPLEFDFLSVDVEGHDEKALSGLDLGRFRPRVIVAETHAVNLGQIEQSLMAKHLGVYGYRPIAAHWTNLFFKRS